MTWNMLDQELRDTIAAARAKRPPKERAQAPRATEGRAPLTRHCELCGAPSSRRLCHAHSDLA